MKLTSFVRRAQNDNGSTFKYVAVLGAILVVALIAIAPFVVPIAYGGRPVTRMQAAQKLSISPHFPESQ
jgi:O-antigen/teichoic acid export membrane protein